MASQKFKKTADIYDDIYDILWGHSEDMIIIWLLFNDY